VELDIHLLNASTLSRNHRHTPFKGPQIDFG
jgi:hypothetical protein